MLTKPQNLHSAQHERSKNDQRRVFANLIRPPLQIATTSKNQISVWTVLKRCDLECFDTRCSQLLHVGHKQPSHHGAHNMLQSPERAQIHKVDAVTVNFVVQTALRETKEQTHVGDVGREHTTASFLASKASVKVCGTPSNVLSLRLFASVICSWPDNVNNTLTCATVVSVASDFEICFQGKTNLSS